MSLLVPSSRRDLRIMTAEGMAFSVTVGAGESYLAAFAIALGFGPVTTGLLTTIPLLAGGLIQLVTPIGVRWAGSRRRWSVGCAVVQALSFLPLIVGALVGRLPAAVVFLAASLYWATGMAVGPAWNAWVEGLVPRGVRHRYFARRNSAAQLALLGALLAAGLTLQIAGDAGRPLLGFALLFLLAGVGRAVSARLLASQSERLPVEIDAEMRALPLIRRPPTGPAGGLLVYLLTLTGSVMLAGPFFSPYMLSHLRLEYWQYMTLLAAALAAKVLVLPLWGHVARRVGLPVVLRTAWIGIAPLPAMWLVSDSFYWLLGLQVMSGVFWAAHEYVSFLLLFETIPSHRRVGVLTAFNLGHAVATASGAVLGGMLFNAVGAEAGGYVAIFGASTAARTACLFLLMRVQGMPKFVLRPLVLRPVAVRPSTGVMLRPILATVRRRRGVAAEDRRRGRGEGRGDGSAGDAPSSRGEPS
jgi:MFS family permease